MRSVPRLLCLAAAATVFFPPTAAAQVQGSAVTPEMIYGYWSDNGDCSKGMLIRANRTFRSYRTGDEGSWTLDGDLLTLSYEGGSQALRLLAVEPNEVIIAESEGAIGHSFRCETPPPATNIV